MDENDFFLPTIVDGEDKTSALKNCIRNKYKHLRKWAKRTRTNSLRIYDKEIKEYPLAIDYYDGRYCVQFFTSTRETDEAPTELITEVEKTICSLFGAEKEAIHWRTRIKRAKTEQYEKVDDEKEFFNVLEYGVKFRINLNDYLDTGLFLDHRETRQMVANAAKGKRLLNLFAYTCSFSVHAAIAGAIYTKSVDMSNTYIAWGEENFKLNSLPMNSHEFVRADCLKFLNEELRTGTKYDVIIIDPPTISRSKKMDGMFDIQEDYIFLITRGLKLLSPGGVLFFSTNSRKFNFDESHFVGAKIMDISAKTIPLDFHSHKIHRCWKLMRE
jgi:23S rRNA (cytosine1962-C5)-methyltransferase